MLDRMILLAAQNAGGRGYNEVYGTVHGSALISLRMRKYYDKGGKS
jgi:hypothetical protein